jgi:hypothetical protein
MSFFYIYNIASFNSFSILGSEMNFAFLYITARLRSGYDEYMQQEFRSSFSILPRSGETRQPECCFEWSCFVPHITGASLHSSLHVEPLTA